MASKLTQLPRFSNIPIHFNLFKQLVLSFIDYLYYNDYYAALLGRLKAALLEKRPRLQRKKVLFHEDKTPSQTSPIAMAKINELGFELFPRPRYSLDLAPSEYFLLPNLKKWLGGQKFKRDDEIIDAVKAILQTSTKIIF